MTSLQKLRKLHLFKCVSLLCSENRFIPSQTHIYTNGSPHILQLLRFCRIERAVNLKNGGNSCELTKKSRLVREEAQAALLEYFHSTRSLQFLDAENMSKNAPVFFDKLLKKVDTDAGRSLARFLRYHPINEFEPFFESIGLEPSEYKSFLPRNLMFLNDDQLLLENYYVLCNYGIARNRIGKIYKEAMEVFRYDYGVLQSKLGSFENLGLEQSLVVKIIASCPYLLKGDVNRDFLVFLEKLKNVGIEYSWLEEHISEDDSYDWKCMFELVCLLGDLCLTEKKLGVVIKNHPNLLFEKSGRVTICLFGLLLKFGLTQNDVPSVFREFPDISVAKFSNNLCECYKFLVEIKMPVQDIGSLFLSHPIVLGSYKLKKVTSLLATLNCGTGRLCQMIKEDPHVLKKWALGVRVDRVQEPNRILRVRMIKTEFLLSLGFVEKSKEMERALKVFRGRGVELQERFDCLVSTGLSRENVISMLKVSPQILNQSKEVIQTKIDFFIRELGYPVSTLISHPAVLSYTTQRVKLRLLMYKWLQDKGAVNSNLALSTIFSCSEKVFMKTYINSHPRGPEFWESLKKKVYAD